MTELEYYQCKNCDEGRYWCDLGAPQRGRMPPTYCYECEACGHRKYMLCYEDFVASNE